MPTTESIIAAEYTKCKVGGILTINEIRHGRRKFINHTTVSGRREARMLAVQQGASPWNF